MVPNSEAELEDFGKKAWSSVYVVFKLMARHYEKILKQGIY